MAILILGGRGNLGSQLTAVFQEDYETISLDFEDLDVLDFALLRERVREIRPILIINAVAYNAVDNCETKEGLELAHRLNIDLPGVLADLALESGATLVHYSSDYVFSGTAEKQFFLEHETPNPLNKYGESKFLGEVELQKRAIRGLEYYLIRTSKLFGPAGISPAAKSSFFDIMLRLAAEKQSGEELTVVNEEVSCFTYTPDLAKATKRLWELKVPYGVFHLVNEDPSTWYGAAQELFRLRKMTVKLRSIRSEDLLRLARRPKFSVLKNTKLKKLRSFRQALAEYLDSQISSDI
jgi:dTDP-4-dehydrorhamnose reductase